MSPAAAPRLRAAVLGRPVAHSLSPVLHRAACAVLGLEVDYTREDLGEDEVAGFLAHRLGAPGCAAAPAALGDGEDWLGCSVTMPLKAAVVAAADERTARVSALGVANTLVRDHPDHPGRILAHNTDVDGIVRALADGGLDASARGGTVGVLGNGGTASAAVAAAHALGADAVRFGVREPGRAADVVRLARGLGMEAVACGQEELVAGAGRLRAVVATLPPRAADPLAEAVADAALPPLLDAAYDPWPSALARAWSEAGGTVVSGVAMLLHQGVEQVRLFTERPRRERCVPEPDWDAVTRAAAQALRSAALPGGVTRRGTRGGA